MAYNIMSAAYKRWVGERRMRWEDRWWQNPPVDIASQAVCPVGHKSNHIVALDHTYHIA